MDGGRGAPRELLEHDGPGQLRERLAFAASLQGPTAASIGANSGQRSASSREARTCGSRGWRGRGAGGAAAGVGSARPTVAAGAGTRPAEGRPSSAGVHEPWWDDPPMAEAAAGRDDGGVVLRPAVGPEDHATLAGLFERYVVDLSAHTDHYVLDGEGRWQPDGLAPWWDEEGRFRYLVEVDGRPAGFVLVGAPPFPWVSPGATTAWPRCS